MRKAIAGFVLLVCALSAPPVTHAQNADVSAQLKQFLDTTAAKGVQYYYRVVSATTTVGVPASGSAVLA